MITKGGCVAFPLSTNKETLRYRDPIDLDHRTIAILPKWLFFLLSLVGLAQYTCTKRLCTNIRQKWYHPNGHGILCCRYEMSDESESCKLEYHSRIEIGNKYDVLVTFQPIISKKTR